jgi:hypothetical protein
VHSWPGLVALDRAGANVFVVVSCASLRQCTAVNELGHEVTFNPRSPGRTWRHKVDVPGVTISCPTTILCVGVSTVHPPHHGLAFHPRSGRVLRVWRISHTGYSVTCASASQCTAVGTGAREDTFNPKTGAIISNDRLVPGGSAAITAVTCPSRRQCSAVFTDISADFEVTFDPISGKANPAGERGLGGFGLRALSCPSTSQCTGVGDQAQEVTFDPRTGQLSGFATVESGSTLQTLGGVSCPSLDQCTAVDVRGNEMTFDPTTGTLSGAGVEKTGTGKNGNTLDCPTVNQCTVLGSGGKEATFNPAAPVEIIAHWIHA